MKVTKAVTSENEVFFCEATRENAKKLMKKFPSGLKMTRLEMSKTEYRSIPATNRSYEVFN